MALDQTAISMSSMNQDALIDQQAVMMVTAGYDHMIRFWEALTGNTCKNIQHPDSQVNKIAISPDKKILAAAGNPLVRLYHIQSNHPYVLATFDGHTANVTCLAFQTQSKWMASGSEDGTIKIWDFRTFRVQRDYHHKYPVNDLVIHPNQGEIISCDQHGSIKIWDLAANACTHELVPEEDCPMRSVTVASDGSFMVAGNTKGQLYVWALSNKQDCSSIRPVTKIKAHDQYLLRCLLSPDVKSLVTTSADHSIKIFSTSSWKCSKVLNGHTRWVWDCAFSADSLYLVTASSDHTARLWDLQLGESIKEYIGHQKAVVCLALNDIV